MFTIDAYQAAGHSGLAAERRARVAVVGGNHLATYPCGWQAGTRVTSTKSMTTFADAISHKAWRPKESSP